jgi:hypothetical protein
MTSHFTLAFVDRVPSNSDCNIDDRCRLVQTSFFVMSVAFPLFISSYESWKRMDFTMVSSYMYLMYFDPIHPRSPPMIPLPSPAAPPFPNGPPSISFYFPFLFSLFSPSRLHTWEKTCNICLSEPGLFHVTWRTPVPCIF